MTEKLSVCLGSSIYWPSKMRRMSKRKRKIEMKRRLKNTLTAKFLDRPINEKTREQLVDALAYFLAGFHRVYSVDLEAA
jgi:hypothetical protein